MAEEANILSKTETERRKEGVFVRAPRLCGIAEKRKSRIESRLQPKKVIL